MYPFRPRRMFTQMSLPKLKNLEQTEEPALKRGVAVTVLVPEMSKSMKMFKEEQAEQSALERGVTVTDFIEDIVVANKFKTSVSKCDKILKVSYKIAEARDNVTAVR